MVTDDYKRAQFLTNILSLLISKQEKHLVLKLKYNIVYITYNKNLDIFQFAFLNNNELLDIDFHYFSKTTELNFRQIVLFTIEKPVMI